MNKINFQDGTKVSNAKVTIDGVDYPVTSARYDGATPLSAYVMNKLQDNIEDAIDQNADNIGGEDYDATSTYDVGDIVKYQGQLYKCTTEISTAEDWTVAHWTETSIVEEIDNGGGGSQVLGDALPIGIIMEYPGSNIPSGWLLCDGQAVSRTLYSELFNLLGTTYGSGDGSTTFNIPNLKGKVAVGKDENDTDFDTLGETGGEKTHTLTENEMPTHTHSIGKPVSTNSGSNSWLLLDVNKGEYSEQRTQPSGGGQAHNNLQPYIVQNFIIKAKQTTPTTSNIVNEYSTSTTDGYSANYVNNYVEGLHTYSATETIVGTWIDGKPLYRKVITYSKNGGGDFSFNHNIANIGNYWLGGESNINSNGTVYSLNMINTTQNLDYQWRKAGITSTQIIGYIGEYTAGATAWIGTFVIYYTKTTD